MIHHGDCLEVLPTLPADSIDSIVTDPPYGLSFMGKNWDHGIPGEAFWSEALRAAKPGAHLLAFGGTRTFHRLTCAIEDAGWEIRDCIMWVYGSGFPKSHDVSKAIDKNNGESGRLWKFTAYMRTTGLTAKQLNEATGTFMGSHYLTDKSQPAIPTPELWHIIRPLCCDVPAWVDELVERIGAEREVVGFQARGKSVNTDFMSGGNDITAPATPSAQQWQGWGTALKPAWEPIIVARKPLKGTVAQNVQAFGTGAVNVDGCRVGNDSITTRVNTSIQGGKYASGNGRGLAMESHVHSGRWPANLIHDGSDEVLGLFPETGPAKSAARGGTNPNPMDWGNGRSDGHIVKGHDDNGGSAARFFYCAKASKADRDEGCEGLALVTHQSGMGGAMPVDDDGNARDRFKAQSRNHHPTVKPTDLMRYLCRLVTPPGGTVLDPFCGSGSTGKAATLEGFEFIGIEREAEYVEIARARIAHARGDMPLLEAVR